MVIEGPYRFCTTFSDSINSLAAMDAKILWENAPIEVKLHKFWNGCAKSTKLKNIYHEITHKPKKL